MFRSEQNTVNRILGDIRAIDARNYTCVKIESISVTSTAVHLNPPPVCDYCVIQVVNVSASSGTQVLRVSECSTTPATTVLGIVLGDLDIYDIKGSNNINGATFCSIDAVTNKITVAYYNFS